MLSATIVSPGGFFQRPRRFFAGLSAAVFLATSSLAYAADHSAALKEARDIVNAHLTSPEFWAPPAFDTSKANGKTVWWIADLSSNITQQWADAAKEAAELVGLKINFFDPGASAPEHVRGFNTAIAAGADAIVLGDGTAAVEYSAQVTAAKEAGIPVFSLVSHPLGEPRIDGLVADISYNYPEAGKLLADWFVADSDGEGHALLIDLQGIPSSGWELTGFKDELARLGTNARVTEIATSLGQNLQADVANATSTAVLRDPTIDYVIPPFDSLALFAQTGLTQLGAAGAKIKTAGFNTIIPQMQNLQTGGTPLQIDLGGPNVWLGYAVIDNVLRALNGQPAIHDYRIGYKVFTHENVQGLDVSRENDLEWYGVDYGALFKPVWRIK